MGVWPWFMFALAVFTLIASFLDKKASQLPAEGVLLGSVLISLLIGFISEINGSFSLSRIFVFFPFYYAGYKIELTSLNRWIKNYRDKKGRLICFTFLTFTFILFLCLGNKVQSAFVYVFKAMYPYSRLATFTDHYLLWGLLGRLGFYFLSTFMSFSILVVLPRSLINIQVDKLGQRTLAIYMFHFTLLSLSRKVFDHLGLDFSMENGFFIFLWAFILSIIIVLLLSRRIFTKMIRKISIKT